MKKIDEWRSILVQNVGCKSADADVIITSLKRRFKRSPTTAIAAIDTLFKDKIFLSHLRHYIPFGLKAVNHWIDKQKSFSNLPSLEIGTEAGAGGTETGAGAGDTPQTEAGTGNGQQQKQHINIYGQLITAKKCYIVDQVAAKAEQLVKELTDTNADKKLIHKQVKYFFHLIARKLDTKYNSNQAPVGLDRQGLYDAILNRRKKQYLPESLQKEFEGEIDKVVEEIKLELTTPLSGEKFIEHLDVEISLEDNYAFSTKNSFCVWFSNNPKVAMPDKIKSILQKRAMANQPGTTKVVYSKQCLTDDVNADFCRWAETNGIELVDIDKFTCESETDKQLLIFAQEELRAMRENEGGNPAAASDMVRWIGGIIGNDPITYVDADMPMCDEADEAYIATGTVTAGHPVLLNMGSVLEKNGERPPLENVAFNTDIIAFSANSAQRQTVLEKVGKALIGNYVSVLSSIESSQHPAFQMLSARPGFKTFAKLHQGSKAQSILPSLRHELSKAHGSILNYIEFIGVEAFANYVGCPGEKLLFQEALTQRNEELLNIALVARMKGSLGEAKELTVDERKVLVKEYLQKQLALLYKPLVMEMSGPSAITHEVLKSEALQGQPPTHLENLREPHSQPMRVLEAHACVAGKTNFVSDNIPRWSTPREQVEAEQEQRTDGLSWMPNNQKKLAMRN